MNISLYYQPTSQRQNGQYARIGLQTTPNFSCRQQLQQTRSSATTKSTARPSCLVSVLYDIYREKVNRSTANQPLLRNWSRN